MSITYPLAGVVPSGAGECGVCTEGWVQVRDGKGGAMAWACACPRGVPKTKHAAPILKLLTETEVAELWPRGLPETSATLFDQLAAAGLPPAWFQHTLDTYRKHFTRAESKRTLDLAMQWLDQADDARSDLVMFGPPGTGKTGLAVALVQALVRRGVRPQFTDARLLMARWRSTYDGDGGPKELDLLNDVITAPLFVVDEATSGGDSSWVERSLTLLVDQRQRHRRPTILTLNMPGTDEDGQALLPVSYPGLLAAALGPALYDRLRERAQFWLMAGASQRRRRGAKSAD